MAVSASVFLLCGQPRPTSGKQSDPCRIEIRSRDLCLLCLLLPDVDYKAYSSSTWLPENYQ
jgi:hypothetical protein